MIKPQLIKEGIAGFLLEKNRYGFYTLTRNPERLFNAMIEIASQYWEKTALRKHFTLEQIRKEACFLGLTHILKAFDFEFRSYGSKIRIYDSEQDLKDEGFDIQRVSESNLETLSQHAHIYLQIWGSQHSELRRNIFSYLEDKCVSSSPILGFTLNSYDFDVKSGVGLWGDSLDLGIVIEKTFESGQIKAKKTYPLRQFLLKKLN